MNISYHIAAVVAGLVLILGGTPSWGGLPPDNDKSDNKNNTGGGTDALRSNTTGNGNTALGSEALLFNTEGGVNTALGSSALASNRTGNGNIALGSDALLFNTTGIHNVASGPFALRKNTTASFNTALGSGALAGNTTGGDNTASGAFALQNSTGTGNIALGTKAGGNLTNGDRNIYLGNEGAATESQTMRLGGAQTRTFIAGIAGTPVSGSTVVINGEGQLGTVVSSARYKKDIQDMSERSRKVLTLRPVTFHYQQDSQGQQQYGLIAEEVARVYPELVTRTATGEAESVQYHTLIPMLLNELQRQQQQIGVQTQQLTVQAQQLAELHAQNAALAERLTQLEKQAAQAMTLTSR